MQFLQPYTYKKINLNNIYMTNKDYSIYKARRRRNGKLLRASWGKTVQTVYVHSIGNA